MTENTDSESAARIPREGTATVAALAFVAVWIAGVVALAEFTSATTAVIGSQPSRLLGGALMLTVAVVTYRKDAEVVWNA